MENETIDIKEQLKNYLSYIIIDEIKVFHHEPKIVFKELKNEVNPCFFYQFYIDERLNYIYIYFALDLISQYGTNPTDLYTRIKYRILNNIYREFKIHPIIADSKVCSYDLLSMHTYSLWKINNSYCFIKNKVFIYKDIMGKILNDTKKYQSIMDFEFEISRRLNTNYNIGLSENNSRFPELFDEYAAGYEELFGTKLTPFSLDETVCVYMDK